MSNREALLEIRRDREELARVLKKHSGIRKIVEDLYPDSAHFIYELLQNAEDTGATEARFTLMQSSLRFVHNGRAFDKKDVEAITDIGEGTKANDDDKIGRFGVGFKAVFAYSETPRIYSSSFSFEISELVLPNPIDTLRGCEGKTVFDFPFNNPKKRPETAYVEIKKAFDSLAEITILFLPHIESISWEIEGVSTGELLRVAHSDAHCEILKQINGKTATSTHFLKFNETVSGLEKQKIAIAFELSFLADKNTYKEDEPLAGQLRVTPAKPGNVAVFFPAEKETSNLRFHLHAPFVPELSRASIKDTPANLPLFRQLAELAAESLHKIKDMGLLTRDFLEVLPNSHDAIPERYAEIIAKIRTALKTEKLTPTHSKSHAAALNLIQGQATLKGLLSEDDLEFLIEDPTPPQWSVSATQKNSHIDHLLSDLEIAQWGIDDFAKVLKEKIEDEETSASVKKWLHEKSPEWHQQMYAMFYQEMRNSYLLKSRLQDTPIVLLDNRSHVRGNDAFFPANALTQDQSLPWINPETYTSGNSPAQKDAAKKFLQEIGVREAGESEQVEVILKRRYTKEAEVPDTETYLSDLKRFISLLKKDKNRAGLLADYFIFHSQLGEWCTPACVFLDAPFKETALGEYYTLLGEEANCYPLHKEYLDYGLPREDFLNFLETVGVKTRLEIVEIRSWENPNYSQLRAGGGGWSNLGTDRDYTIDRLEELLESVTIPIAMLVWETMHALPAYARELQAVYQSNARSTRNTADSQLVHTLKNSKWIPQRKDDQSIFVKPIDADSALLPEGFSFDAGWAWIKAIRFGQDIQHAAILRQSEQQRKQEAAQRLGFESIEAVEQAKQFAALPEDVRVSFLQSHSPRKPSFPERNTTNPERRKERVSERYNESEGVTHEKKLRSVRTTAPVTDKKAWLKSQYTNDDGQMICQMCKNEMPFKLRGSIEYYFEAVQIADDVFQNEDHIPHLSLCPLCAAKYKQLLKKDDESLKDFLSAIEDAENSNEPIIIDLGDNQTGSIRFVEQHLVDLKAILEQEIQSEDDDLTAVPN